VHKLLTSNSCLENYFEIHRNTPGRAALLSALALAQVGRLVDFVERLWRSVKYEDIYLKAYAGAPELLIGLTEYFERYNTLRPHQSLGYATPDLVYRTGQGGGVCIVDKYPKADRKVAKEDVGQR
jgi:putative transposase